MFYKRKILSLFLAVLFSVIFVFGCNGENGIGNKKLSRFDKDASVHFIDVGQGDCIFINLPDGKTALIDCGPENKDTSNKIIDFLTSAGADKIDYLILTHPQTDHVGNAIPIINTFEVVNAYLPNVKDFRLPLFPAYKSIVELIDEKGIKINYNDCYDVITGDGYDLAFLSPQPYGLNSSEYNDFHTGEIPSSNSINSISAVVYLELFGVRFLLTGDATTMVEQNIFSRLPVLDVHYKEKGINVNLEDIDFLKVAHHGSSDSTSYEFLTKIRPKNAVISVSGNNYYGFPSTELLTRLYTVNPELNIFRTDVNGTVSVKVDKSGDLTVLTDTDFS